MLPPPGMMFATRPVASARELDHAREILSQVFLPVEFPSARTSSSVDIHLNALTVGRITCGHMRFQHPLRIETAEPTDFHIDIPTGGRAKMRAGLSSPVYGTEQTAGVFMPGRPVDLDCGERFEQISLMIPRDHLRRELENLLGAELTRPLEFTSAFDLRTSGARTMMEALHVIDAASADEGGSLAHPLASQRLEQVLLQTLLFAQPHNYSAALLAPAPAAGARPVQRAAELLRADPAHPWTVPELAAEVFVSARSLQEGFRRSLGTTPMTFLRQLRLAKVHEALVAATPDTASVSDIAAQWGFAHLGRFAAAYRVEFAELPSETLRSPATPGR